MSKWLGPEWSKEGIIRLVTSLALIWVIFMFLMPWLQTVVRRPFPVVICLALFAVVVYPVEAFAHRVQFNRHLTFNENLFLLAVAAAGILFSAWLVGWE